MMMKLLTVLSVFTLAFLVTAVAATPTNAPSPSGVKQLWRAYVYGAGGNIPYYNPSKDWLYVSYGVSGVAILNGSNGTKIKSVGNGGLGPTGSSVVPGDNGKIYYMSGAVVYCRDAETLDLVWNYTTSSTYSTTPLYVASKKAVYVSEWLGYHVFKLDAETGKVLWDFFGNRKMVGARVSYSQKHDMAFSGSESGVFAINDANANMAWYFWTNMRVFTPILSDDEDSVFFGSRTNYGYLYSAVTATGKQNWNIQLLSDDFDITAPLYFRGTLYFPCQTSCHAVDAATGKQLWSFGDCPNGGALLAQKYGDAMVFSSQGNAGKGIQAVALNGSGTVWSWSGAFTYVIDIMAPRLDGKMWVSDNNGNTYALQLPPATSIEKVERK